MSFLDKIFKTSPIPAMQPVVLEINLLEAEFEKKSREELRAQTKTWQQELKKFVDALPELDPNDIYAPRKQRQEIDARLEQILPQAFAAVREAAKRTLAQRHFDVQLLGGMVLNMGKIAEMKTGEGKTLASTSAIYLNALVGKGTHIVTVNDYLARRDASWMGQIFDYLGLTVGVIQHDQAFKYSAAAIASAETAASNESKSKGEDLVTEAQLDVKNIVPCARQEAYACDITYGTNNEYGFDYLRDNMVSDLSQKVQGELFFAIVDEVDSILIDEARTPLIISAPDTAPTDQYYEFAKVVEQLKQEEDYQVDEKKKSATLTEPGIARLEKLLGVENIYVEKGVATVHHIEQALRAKTLFKLDRDYVVRNGEIMIVDEFTGRLLPGRRYSEGLHQAIEAKEGVEVQRESKTLATITFQNYFRLYRKLAGMTGTAMTEAEEFQKIYGLDPVEVPTNNPMIRKDFSDAVFKNEDGKFQALAKEVRAKFETGQPVLIGTVSIEKNERISEILKAEGVPHQVLNAKNHEQEAKIIAQAGRKKSVTLATNIAGRGVDIVLGGMPYDKNLADEVRALGGLHVLGTERHESRRIDNQLRGRSGRQGDPGSSQFFVALEDDLIRLFGGERVKQLMNTMGVPDDMPIENAMVSRVIESAQKKIEGLNFDVRKHVLEFDDVMNKHREVIYRIRNRALQPEAVLKDEILQKVEVEISNLVVNFTTGAPSDWDLKGLFEALSGVFAFDKDKIGKLNNAQEYVDYFVKTARELYEAREQKFGSSVMRQIEKLITLQGIDSLWMEHLDTMDHLRDSVRLRGYAQRDPLVEYKKDGFDMFQRLLAEIDKTVVYTIFKVELGTAPRAPQPFPMTVNTSAPRGTGGGDDKIGRNDPCFCGSGKKYKKCGMLNTAEHQQNIAKGSGHQQRIGG